MFRFRKNIAQLYGVKTAVVAQFIWDSVETGNYDKKTYFHEGKYWCRCSVKIMTGYMPFLTTHMIRDSINVLLKDKVIRKGCFNADHFDKTTWYCFTDYGRCQMMQGSEKDGG